MHIQRLLETCRAVVQSAHFLEVAHVKVDAQVTTSHDSFKLTWTLLYVQPGSPWHKHILGKNTTCYRYATSGVAPSRTRLKRRVGWMVGWLVVSTVLVGLLCAVFTSPHTHPMGFVVTLFGLCGSLVGCMVSGVQSIGACGDTRYDRVTAERAAKRIIRTQGLDMLNRMVDQVNADKVELVGMLHGPRIVAGGMYVTSALPRPATTVTPSRSPQPAGMAEPSIRFFHATVSARATVFGGQKPQVDVGCIRCNANRRLEQTHAHQRPATSRSVCTPWALGDGMQQWWHAGSVWGAWRQVATAMGSCLEVLPDSLLGGW